MTGELERRGGIQGHSLFLKVLGDLVTQSCWSQDFQLGGQPAWALSSIVVDFFCLVCFVFWHSSRSSKQNGQVSSFRAVWMDLCSSLSVLSSWVV